MVISCTEFIPLYSEFFKFLEKLGGHGAVEQYWRYVADNRLGDKNNPLSMISFLERDGGFDGAVNYWNMTLREEACDLLRVTDREVGVCYTHMRKCPSKGMLINLDNVTPDYDYCGQCRAIYTYVLDKYGIHFAMDTSREDNAECEFWFCKKGTEIPDDFKRPKDGRVVIDMKAEDNKYFHPGFYISCDFAMKYCLDTYGEGAIRDFLYEYATEFYSGVIERARSEGLSAIADWITGTYSKDEASVPRVTITDSELVITVDESPAISFMKKVNHKPNCVIMGNRYLYSAVAEACGCSFRMEELAPSGYAKFTFSK